MKTGGIISEGDLLADIFSKAKRRTIMQNVRRQNTEPERYLAELLNSAGHSFVQHPRTLDGQPDFYFPKLGLVIFVHGCFWHGHIHCSKGLNKPKSNVHYWVNKITRNHKRDNRVAKGLRNKGLSVYTLWECEIRRKGIPARLVTRLFR